MQRQRSPFTKRQRRPRASLRIKLFTATVVLLAIVAAAAHFSGWLSVAVVSGDSMAPAIARGDLVIVRQTAQYEPGQIVAYNNPDLGLLLHRIIARTNAAPAGPQSGAGAAEESARFILQGDSKNAPDAYEPLPSEIRGQLLWRIPRAGRLFDSLRNPIVRTTLVALGLALILFPLLRKSDRRRTAMRRLSTHTQSWSRQLLTGLFIAGLVSAGALAALQVIGPTREAPVTNEYQHRGTFSYSAPGGEAVYDSGVAKAGDPLFRAVSDTAAVTFTYQFESALPPALSGSYRLDARISQSNGWTRTVALVPPTSFDQTSVTVDTELHFADLQRLVDRAAERTGVSENSFTLALLAQVDVQATLAGRSLVDHFATTMKFLVDAKQALLMPDVQDSDPLADTQSGSALTTRTEARALSLVGVSLSAATARKAAAAVLGVSLVLLIAAALHARFAARDGEVAMIRARYRQLLVPATVDALQETAPIQVFHFSDLVKLAEVEGLPILDAEADRECRFLVVKSDITYCCRPAVTTPPSQPPADLRAA